MVLWKPNERSQEYAYSVQLTADETVPPDQVKTESCVKWKMRCLVCGICDAFLPALCAPSCLLRIMASLPLSGQIDFDLPLSGQIKIFDMPQVGIDELEMTGGSGGNFGSVEVEVINPRKICVSVNCIRPRSKRSPSAFFREVFSFSGVTLHKLQSPISKMCRLTKFSRDARPMKGFQRKTSAMATT